VDQKAKDLLLKIVSGINSHGDVNDTWEDVPGYETLVKWREIAKEFIPHHVYLTEFCFWGNVTSRYISVSPDGS
jgi:hypothetical protein